MSPGHKRRYTHRWKSDVGRITVQGIVKARFSEWTDGLRDWQLDLVVRILDGEDVLLSTATGDGKSAIFTVPIVVLLEMRQNPGSHPQLPYRDFPMGIVIAPTKGLAANIVFELSKFNVKALSYCSETLTEARKTGLHLWKEIAAGDWPLVCIDLEHLMDKDWELITNTDIWRENISFLCVDEVHLVDEWGEEFRPPFRHIGRLARSRCPPTISVFALSATVEPGRSTATICAALGFVDGLFHHERRTNECPNIHFCLNTLTHTLGGDNFPDLLPFLAKNRKTVIYCSTIELSWRVLIYLWSLLPPGSDKLTRIRMYHAMCWPDDNEETVRLIRDVPRCQIVIATIAFAQGFNVKALLDSIQLGIAKSLNQILQQEGRIGQDHISLSRGVVLAQAKAIEIARRYMQAFNSAGALSTTAVVPSKPPQKKKRSSKPVRVDHSKAILLVEKGCLIALRNVIYGNPPLEQSRLDCIEANQKVPCSRCLPKSGVILDFQPSPLPSDHPPLPPFRAYIHYVTLSPLPSNSSPLLLATASITKPDLPLSMKMRAAAEAELVRFGDNLRILEKGNDVTGYRPRSAYFPTPALNTVVGNLMRIESEEDVQSLLPQWKHHEQHGARLLAVVHQLQATFRDQHNEARLLRNEKNRVREKAKRDAACAILEDMPVDKEVANPEGHPCEDLDVSSQLDKPTESIVVDDPTSSRKRPALENHTNQPKAKRAQCAPQESVAAVLETLVRPYRTRADRARPSREHSDENTAPPPSRRSTRQRT